MKTRPTGVEPNPEEIAAAIASINSAFAGLTQLFAEIGESVMTAIRAVEAAKAAGLANTEPWPFQPGDMIHETDDAAALKLDAAPDGTIVLDRHATEWAKRDSSWWIEGGSAGGAGAPFMVERGPLTVVSVGGAAPTALADSENGVADPGFLLVFLMVFGLVSFGAGVAVLVDAVIG